MPRRRSAARSPAVSWSPVRTPGWRCHTFRRASLSRRLMAGTVPTPAGERARRNAGVQSEPANSARGDQLSCGNVTLTIFGTAAR